MFSYLMVGGSNPGEIILQILPPTTLWAEFRLDSWLVDNTGQRVEDETDVAENRNFSTILSVGDYQYSVIYRKYGFLYGASIVTLSPSGIPSSSLTVTYTTSKSLSKTNCTLPHIVIKPGT